MDHEGWRRFDAVVKFDGAEGIRGVGCVLP